VRPTLDRIREALFSLIGGERVRGASVLDLYAGSGALGLEALSRHAAEAHLVESNPAVVKVLRSNAERLKATGAVIHAARVEQAVRRLGAAGRRFDLVFLDPPYGKGLVPRTLQLLDRALLVREGGMVVAEHEVRFLPPREVDGFFRTDWRKYGDTAVTLYSPLLEEVT